MPTREFRLAFVVPDDQLTPFNSVNDRTVPYPTAAIEVSDPFVDRKTKGIEV